ncbi:hypothetical protein DQQ01_03310 [Blautia argi]|uniref:Uncharacterized protein n=1 Tax=Blautia argi TaxID=1912897 RepID=A0A2Z4U8J6_9FIRM|nr:hypothetical protein DQQ01_03310 [Blautia argi]
MQKNRKQNRGLAQKAAVLFAIYKEVFLVDRKKNGIIENRNRYWRGIQHGKKENMENTPGQNSYL